MNRTKRIVIKIGFMLCFAFIVAPAKCQTYPGEPYSRGGYEEASPSDMSFYMEIRSEQDFYEPLGTYGRWVVVEPYGRCWFPERVDSDWRPYSEGYWVRTDAGWYWESEEPWAWATYHYGRWGWYSQYGWVWVPQTQWAPAWVSWRQGEGYLGWAPLPPSARFSISGFVEFREADIAPRAFVFVEERRFLEHLHPSTVIVNNTTIIQKTVYITNMQVVNNTVMNEGPRTAVIEQVSGQKVQAVQVRELRRKQESNVVNRQRNSSAGHEKKAQTPVPRDAQSRGVNALPVNQQHQSENTAVITNQPKGHSQDQNIQASQEQKRAATFTQQDTGQQAPKETKRETHSEQARPVIIPAQAKPETRKRPAMKGPIEQRVEKHVQKQEKRVNEQEKKAQPSEQGRTEKQVTSDQGAQDTGKNDHGKKGRNKKGEEQ